MPVTTLPLFRRGSWRASLDTSRVSEHLHVGLAPEIVLIDDAKWARARIGIGEPAGDLASRRRLLLDAMDLFENATLAIGDAQHNRAEFHALLGESAGLPESLIDRWSAMLRDYIARADPAPGVFTLISLPGNTFTCLESVCDAILGGGEVWVRPSRKEPLSAARFVAALLAAGWSGERIGFYATAPHSVRTLARATDRQVIYGGDDVARSFRATPTATVHGPGGTVAFVEDTADVASAARALCAQVASDSGRFCTNVRTIVCWGDIEPLAEALAGELDSVPLANLAHVPDERDAHTIAEDVLCHLAPEDTIVTRRPLIIDERGRTYLAPLLVHVKEPHAHPLVGRELPFPFATILRGSRELADVSAAGSVAV